MSRFAIAVLIFVGLSGCHTIEAGKAGPDYKVLAVQHIDSSGLYWLEKLDDDVKNGCVDKNENYKVAFCSKTIATAEDSAAEKKCESFGARLPTIEEYQRLLQDFQADSDLEKGLSPASYHDIALEFKDTMPYAAWTSSVRADDPTQALFFSFRKGSVKARYEYRSVELPVRCVRKPKK